MRKTAYHLMRFVGKWRLDHAAILELGAAQIPVIDVGMIFYKII